MKFDLTNDQMMIDRTVRELLADRLTDDRLRSHVEGRTTDEKLWKELSELGFASIGIVPDGEQTEGGLFELGLVCESLGWALAPVPLLQNAAAGLLIAHAGSDEQQQRFLPGILDGSTPGTVAVGPEGLRLSMGPGVGDGPWVIVQDGVASIGAADFRHESVATIDLLRHYGRITWVGESERLPGPPASAVDMVQLLIAAELTGVAQRALDLAVEYARHREQFGRKIGTFQGVSHRCAAMLLDVETARSTWRYGTWVARNGDPQELALAASTAKVAGINAALHATTSGLQVLGGIGFTWEHDMHLLLRRARTMSQILGNAEEHRRRIASLLLSTAETRIEPTMGDR